MHINPYLFRPFISVMYRFFPEGFQALRAPLLSLFAALEEQPLRKCTRKVAVVVFFAFLPIIKFKEKRGRYVCIVNIQMPCQPTYFITRAPLSRYTFIHKYCICSGQILSEG